MMEDYNDLLSEPMPAAVWDDIQTALAKTIDQGQTLRHFRKDFDAIVDRHGWRHFGSRAWRCEVMFDTGWRTANAAGKWQQIQRLKAARPYLRYVATLDSRTRPVHLDWHGTVLPVDHPWWDIHYPPNGWYCRCTIQSLSERDLARGGLTVSEAAPPAPLVEHVVKMPRGERRIAIPEGIDPGFANNSGKVGSQWRPYI